MTETEPAEGIVALLDWLRPEPLDQLPAQQVAGVVRRIVAADNADALEVAAFNSSI